MKLTQFDPSQVTGLSESEAILRQQREGFNEIPQGAKRGVLYRVRGHAGANVSASGGLRQPVFKLWANCRTHLCSWLSFLWS